MPAFQDAFISYGRADSKAFVIALKEQLKAKGLGNIWLDLDDIPAATDWQQRIDEAIGRSHQFIYVISPSAMASPYCKLELSLARQYGKRIIPLVHVPGDSNVWATVDREGSAAIRLLNWIFYREGIDDPAQALDKLYGTLSFADDPTSQAYVHQHTALLTQALGWDRHHRQTRYLLVGKERQAAEAWLQTRFADGEPLPCTPTDLHCEYITESIKNASNLMTQVFLCHSDQDQEPAEQIRRSLLRQGITVWNYRTDIQTSQDYNSAIAQGIEEADNILFVLSPPSAQSPYCQRELQQALDLHKRIIPVLAAPTEPGLVPESLRSLQYVDLTDNTQATDYQADESQLLKLLGTDAAYHTEHKTWLVQALKWQRQQQNPTLLLRGYNLRRAEAWLKVARTHRHPPTALHEQFIAESLRQPPDASLDVFISYSRVDSDFARRLNDALQTQGKRTWFDQESIATGSDFQKEIYRGIESSDVFVFVLSPESVNSPFCADEVEYAQGLNKRMVPVLHRAIDVADLHPVLGKLQWLDFREHDGDFQANFAGLLRTLDTDREHLETHTRLLVRAGEWDRQGRDESLLLRGQDLAKAEHWLEDYAEVEPKPTGLQQEYLRAGRATEISRQNAEQQLRRGRIAGISAAAVGFLGMLVSGSIALALLSFNEKLRSDIEASEKQLSEIQAREENLSNIALDLEKEIKKSEKKSNSLLKNIQKLEIQFQTSVAELEIARASKQMIEMQFYNAQLNLSKVRSNLRQAVTSLSKKNEQLLSAEKELIRVSREFSNAKFQLELIEKDLTESVSETLSLVEQQSNTRSAVLYISFIDQLESPSPDSDATLTLWLITPSGSSIRREAYGITKEQVVEAADKLFLLIGSSEYKFSGSFAEAANFLYNTLIGPIENDLISEEIDNIVFLLDSDLRRLPIAVLHDGNQFLVEKFSLSLMPGLTLPEARYTDLKNSKVLLAGVSEYKFDPRFSSLPGVALEIDKISNVWPNIEAPLINEEATIENLVERRLVTVPQPTFKLRREAPVEPMVSHPAQVQLEGVRMGWAGLTESWHRLD